MTSQDQTQKKRKPRQPAARDETGRLRSRTSRWRRSEKGRRGDAARAAVVRALRRGDLARPDRCTECGIYCRAEAHHWSYEPKHHERVHWLCRRCHYRADQLRASLSSDDQAYYGVIARAAGLRTAAKLSGRSEMAEMW